LFISYGISFAGRMSTSLLPNRERSFLIVSSAITPVNRSRVRTHSDPERDDGGEDDGGQEVEGEFVVACGNAPEVLEATERCFDPPAITIAPFIVPDRAFA